VSEKVLSVVDCDSTVELLADFILRQLNSHYPALAKHNIKVVAYEGVAKGAIVNG
jgi:proline dehydrogenase